MIVLDDGLARAEVHPEVGAAIGRYDVLRADGSLMPILQTAPQPSRTGPYALGLNLLVPFSNRISGGGFRHEGEFHPLERNSPGPYPIHGNGLSAAWTVRDVSEHSARLELRSPGPGPFRYRASIEYRPERGSLLAELVVVNEAERTLPYGAGFHPWFVRTPETRLTLCAAGYWAETSDHLPLTYHAVPGDPVYDFSAGRKLPKPFTNTALIGWQGSARLDWPEQGRSVDIEADTPLTTLIIYSPPAGADFVCIEPVSHSVDAHNAVGPGVAPPQILASGEILSARLRLIPR